MKKAFIISCFDWYDKRVKPIYNILNRTYDVHIYLSDFDHINKKKCVIPREACNYVETKIYKKNLSFKRIISHMDFSKKIYRQMMKYKPDLVYALVPPNSVANSCRKYKEKRKNVVLILDIIDMWPESMPVDFLQKTFFYRKWAGMRNKALMISDYVFTECKVYTECLESYLKKNFETLYLYKNFTKEELLYRNTKLQQFKTDDDNSICLGYLGSINYIVDIEEIKNIVRELKKKYKVKFRIIGDGERRDEFLRALSEEQVEIEYYGKIFDEKEKINILINCDYGINMMIDKVKVGLTTKSIDYFSYGLPIINNIKGDTWNMVKENFLGVNVGDNIEFSKCKDSDRKRICKFYDENFTESIFTQKIEKALKSIGL